MKGGGNSGRKPMRLLRWAEPLQEYNYSIIYRPGKENSVADMLSRAINNDEKPIPELENETRADEVFLNTVFGNESLRVLNRMEFADATN